MKLAHIALASILLVGVPMADAATCASEMGAISIDAAVAPDGDIVAEVALSGGDHDSQLPGESQHCIHGHCHHSASFEAGESVMPANAVGAVGIVWRGSGAGPSHVSAGLERPPKA